MVAVSNPKLLRLSTKTRSGETIASKPKSAGVTSRASAAVVPMPIASFIGWAAKVMSPDFKD